MKIVNIHEAKTHLSRLLDEIDNGGVPEIVIAKAGTPVARLLPYSGARAARRGGQWRGLVRIADDFDAPLPAEIAAAFEGRGD